MKPSFSAILDPLLDLVNKHGNSIIGEISAKCLQGAFSLDTPKQDMVTFKIFGIPREQREIDVARRTFGVTSLTSLENVGAYGWSHGIDVPTEWHLLIIKSFWIPPIRCLQGGA